MKLKTLKDLEKMGANALNLNAVFVEIEELKAEAIKWVILSRAIGKQIKEENFMNFHNITEEDLKS